MTFWPYFRAGRAYTSLKCGLAHETPAWNLGRYMMFQVLISESAGIQLLHTCTLVREGHASLLQTTRTRQMMS